MAISLWTPAAHELPQIIDVLASWQRDDAPGQLHPGDIGWQWRFGPEKTASALRAWSRDHRVVALGLLDSSALLRLAIAPGDQHDAELSARILADLTAHDGVLPQREACIEARFGDSFRALLWASRWQADEAWAPLACKLEGPPRTSQLSVQVTTQGQALDRVRIQRAAFEKSIFSEQLWDAMAAGPAYANARCLVGYDEAGEAVAAATVWSAGAGRPGLLEPVGVHREHRRRGHGTQITIAALSALARMGASSAHVCTPSANNAAVAAYRSAGLRSYPEICDFRSPRTGYRNCAMED